MLSCKYVFFYHPVQPTFFEVFHHKTMSSAVPASIIVVFNESACTTLELVTLNLTDCNKEDYEGFTAVC